MTSEGYCVRFSTVPLRSLNCLPHELLFLPRNSRLPKLRGLIVDESFFAKAVRTTSFALSRLTAPRPWRHRFGGKVKAEDLDVVEDLGRRVQRALETGAHPRDHGITAELAKFA